MQNVSQVLFWMFEINHMKAHDLQRLACLVAKHICVSSRVILDTKINHVSYNICYNFLPGHLSCCHSNDIQKFEKSEQQSTLDWCVNFSRSML